MLASMLVAQEVEQRGHTGTFRGGSLGLRQCGLNTAGRAGVAAYPVRHSTRHNLEVAGRFLSRSGPTPQKNCDNGCLDAH